MRGLDPNSDVLAKAAEAIGKDIAAGLYDFATTEALQAELAPADPKAVLDSLK